MNFFLLLLTFISDYEYNINKTKNYLNFQFGRPDNINS